ncbi:MAG: hypothetical protein Salg2KO_16950 [Salibacteraceae bacterium]
MLFNIHQWATVFLSTSLEPGLVLFALFGLCVLVYKYYLDYKRDLTKEKEGALFKAMKMRDVERIMQSAPFVLESKSSYYRLLSTKGKERFRKLLRAVIAQKDFYAKDGLEITDEMIIMSASAFVQLTFGIKGYHLPRFHKVFIYPNVFYNKLLRSNLKGSTSPNGTIRLSWKHLQSGFENDTDGINLALHEVAHALKITITKEDVTNIKLDAALSRFLEHGDSVKESILKGKISTLRKYAALNNHELFACSVEVFFENPEALKSEAPELFECLVETLMQDPTNIEGDYEAPPVKRKSRFKHALSSDRFISNEFMPTVLVLGMMLSWVAIWMVNIHISVSPIPVVLLCASIIVLGFILFYRRLLVSGYTTTGLFIAFLVLGWLSICLSGALLINKYVPVYSIQETYPIESINYSIEDNKEVYEIQLEGATYSGLTVNWKEAELIRSAIDDANVEIQLHYGPFGIKVMDYWTYTFQ